MPGTVYPTSPPPRSREASAGMDRHGLQHAGPTGGGHDSPQAEAGGPEQRAIFRRGPLAPVRDTSISRSCTWAGVGRASAGTSISTTSSRAPGSIAVRQRARIVAARMYDPRVGHLIEEGKHA
jgi:hypothetical protein